MSKKRSGILRTLGTVCVAAYFLFLLAPIAIMVPASFTAHDILSFPPDEFSLRWYEEVLTSRDWIGSASVSLRIAIVAMLVATAAGLLIGFAVFHFGPLGSWLRLLLVSPMLVPHIVIATGLFEILVPLRLLGAEWVLAISHAAMALPITVILAITAFESIDRNFWTAASTLGARWEQITWKVILPVVATSIVACLILSFEGSWHEVTLSVFIGPAVEPTLPSKMFSFLLQESNPALAAVSTLLLFITLFCAGALGVLASRRARIEPITADELSSTDLELSPERA